MENNKRGRKITVNVKENPQYFNEYYRNTNHLVKCSCGQDIFFRSMRNHKLSQRHSKLEKLLEESKKEIL
jgi:hypothetical protein